MRNPNFGRAVDKALRAFYVEMKKQGWNQTTSGWGRVQFTDNTTRGRKHPNGGEAIYGHTFQFKEIFNGPEGATL